MQFGIQFFPTNGPDQLSGADFWGNALACVDLCDELGFSHVRTVEHYFNKYGGYSPSPIAFLSAAAMRTKKARLVTGAVLPIFSHPLKLASELCLLDALSNGRLEAGFARAFLPIEFERFGISLDESKARFGEALDIIIRACREENIAHDGTYWKFPETTIYPRPTQKPHMPIWVAAVQTPESFINAGKNGFGIMAIPMTGSVMKELIELYRKSWKEAGHPGNGKVMLAFHLYCTETAKDARAVGEPELMDYFKAFANAARSWTTGTASKDYANYDKIVEHLDKATFDGQVENCSAWIGTPDMIAKQIERYQEAVGGFETASVQVNFGMMDQKKAHASMRLFSKEVMPRFAKP
ncbi:MAG: LLM class flavin-dependent oxidoreductase [Beijerinckiaceae bacterium]|jgi:alkanesulfonate monooxygenase SsuD/methylene tetrahydromethanopterin reductase-like flavin-dependent oxidoreductase (luciferase family)|nr:LLM class flavin-dependent oxidoreductase [Beijerinckiaceae bacterium]